MGSKVLHVGTGWLLGSTHTHPAAKGYSLHFTRMDFMDRRPASPDRPQAAYRRAVRLALIARRYANPWARNETAIHRQDFMGEGAEYLSVTVTDRWRGTEAHLTVPLEIDEGGRARPDGGCLTLKGIGDDGVWPLIESVSPLLPPPLAGELWAPRGGWWARHRALNPGAWHDSLNDTDESFAASAQTVNGCHVDLYCGDGHQLNIGMTVRESSAGLDIREPAALEDQLRTLIRVFARWGALSASARGRGAPSSSPF